MIRVTALLLLTGLAAGCTQFPELDETATPGVADAPYPALVPLGPLIAEPAAPQATPEAIAEVEARVAGLEARADALGSVEATQAAAVEERLALLRKRAEELRQQE
jgi:hypothetical protein